MSRRFERHFSLLALATAHDAGDRRAEREARGEWDEYRVRPLHQHASATFPRPRAFPPIPHADPVLIPIPHADPVLIKPWPTPQYRRKRMAAALRQAHRERMILEPGYA